MNLEQVAHYIANPHELGLNEAPALKSLSEKHPYAAIFSLLYLTSLSNGKSVDLDAALQEHAYRLSDRTKLYHLVHNRELLIVNGEQSFEVVVTETSAQENWGTGKMVNGEQETGNRELETIEIEIPVVDEVPEMETPTGEVIEEEPTISLLEEEMTEPETISSETAPDSDTTLLDSPSREEENVTEEENVVEEDAFDLVTEAFTREQHFDLDISEEVPVSSTLEGGQREVTSEEILSEDTTEEETSVPPHIAEDTPIHDAEPVREHIHHLLPGEKRSFTSWLKSTGDISASEKQPDLSVEPAPKEEKKKFNEIIENFIKEEPSITRNKTEFFSPSKKAKESLDEDAMPVSETLAKIYAAQGNYPKAIHVYHQLMLSFPEKKSLFAVQIEALKKKITS